MDTNVHSNPNQNQKTNPHEEASKIRAMLREHQFYHGVSFPSETSPDGTFASISTNARYNKETKKVELLVLPYNPGKNKKGPSEISVEKSDKTPAQIAVEGILNETGLTVNVDALVEFEDARQEMPDRNDKTKKHIKYFFMSYNGYSGTLLDSWENKTDPELGKPMWIDFDVLSKTDLLFIKHREKLVQKVHDFVSMLSREAAVALM